MEQLSIKIANILLRNKYIEEAMYSVYQYGIQMAFEVGCSLCSLAIVSATMASNSRCAYIFHDPKKPDSLKQLRKF